MTGLIGADTSGVTIPVTTIAAARKIPQISPSSTAEGLSNKESWPKISEMLRYPKTRKKTQGFGPLLNLNDVFVGLPVVLVRSWLPRSLIPTFCGLFHQIAAKLLPFGIGSWNFRCLLLHVCIWAAFLGVWKSSKDSIKI